MFHKQTTISYACWGQTYRFIYTALRCKTSRDIRTTMRVGRLENVPPPPHRFIYPKSPFFAAYKFSLGWLFCASSLSREKIRNKLYRGRTHPLHTQPKIQEFQFLVWRARHFLQLGFKRVFPRNLQTYLYLQLDLASFNMEY